MTAPLRFSGMAILLLAAGAAWGSGRAAWSAEQTGEAAATAPAEGVLYEDAGAHSSATITQVLPNSSTQNMTLENVRRISVKQGILVIEWGDTATTLLPQQFVCSISINRRSPVSVPTTTPAHLPASVR